MEDLYGILFALPAQHRKALIESHAERMKGAKNNVERLHRVAEALGVAGVAPYRELYLDGNGRLFTWYVAHAVTAGIEQLRDRYLARYEHPIQGQYPDVVEGQDPVFHRMEVRGDQLRLEYAYFGTMMDVPDGWNHITARRFRRCIIIARSNPFTLELRRVPALMRVALMSALCGDLGISEEELAPCLLDTDELRSSLELSLGAVPRGIRKVGRGRGLGTLSITTDGSVSLLEQIDYQGTQGEHHEIYQRSWSFETAHADGYRERSIYAVTIETGDMRVSEGSSEVAIGNLRQNVIAIF